MQFAGIILFAAATLGGVIPTAHDLRTGFHVIARDTADQVLKPVNFAHVQEDRRKVQLGSRGSGN